MTLIQITKLVKGTYIVTLSRRQWCQQGTGHTCGTKEGNPRLEVHDPSGREKGGTGSVLTGGVEGDTTRVIWGGVGGLNRSRGRDPTG